MSKNRKVVKRDERLVDFDEEKIMNAVEAAFNSLGVNIPVRVKRSLLRDITTTMPNPVGVENTQNRIERWLMDNKYFEAAKFLGIDINYNPEYVKFLQTIFGTIKEENEKHSIHDAKRPFIFNTEAVPGESLGIKFYNWDSQDGYEVPQDQNLYNCYFYSPWDETDILSKMKLHGKEVAPYLGGGQAAHLNLHSHLSKEQYLKLFDAGIQFGTNYFTYNIPMTECKECGHVVNTPVTECPKCHSKKLRYWTRIIGHLTCVENWPLPRLKEFYNRLFGDKTIKEPES